MLEQDRAAPVVVENEQAVVVRVAAHLDHPRDDQYDQAEIRQRIETAAQIGQQQRLLRIAVQDSPRRRPHHQRQQRQTADPHDGGDQMAKVANP